jgi:hypothetical protein
LFHCLFWTKRHEWVVVTPVSCSGGPGFKP